MTRLEEGRSATGGVRALLALVIGLGILIVAGVVVVVVTVVHRALAPHRTLVFAAMPAPVERVIDEPAGTRIASVAASGGGEWLALLLTGGGKPDRVVVVDPRDGDRPLGTIRLSTASPPGPARSGLRP